MVVSCAIPEIFICSWGRWGRINCELGEVGEASPCQSPKSAARCCQLLRSRKSGLKASGFRPSRHLLPHPVPALRPPPPPYERSPTAGAARGVRQRCRGTRPGGSSGHRPAGAARGGGAAEGAGGGQGGGRGSRPRGAGEALLLAAAPPRPGGAGNWLQRRYFLIINLFFLRPRPPPPLPSSEFLLAGLRTVRAGG